MSEIRKRAEEIKTNQERSLARRAEQENLKKAQKERSIQISVPAYQSLVQELQTGANDFNSEFKEGDSITFFPGPNTLKMEKSSHPSVLVTVDLNMLDGTILVSTITERVNGDIFQQTVPLSISEEDGHVSVTYNWDGKPAEVIMNLFLNAAANKRFHER